MCENIGERGCVCEVVKFIHHLQSQVKPCPGKIHGCTKPTLGDQRFIKKENTRPFVLYLEDGSLYKAFYEKDGVVMRSPIFRVEKIDGCCALLRVLKIVDLEGRRDADVNNTFCDGNKIVKTNSFVTVDLNCFCGIQCLKDRRIRGV